MSEHTIDSVYKQLLDNSFSNVLKEAKHYNFVKRKPGTINLGVLLYNILRDKFDRLNPDATNTIKKSYYCHLRNLLIDMENNEVECLPVIDSIEKHSYTSSRRNDESINLSIYTSDVKRLVYYPDPNVKVADLSHGNSIMIGRKLTRDGYKNVMTSVEVCV